MPIMIASFAKHIIAQSPNGMQVMRCSTERRQWKNFTTVVIAGGFGRSTSFTFHDTGANLGCQRERAIQPVRHRQIQSGDERDHQGDGTGCSEKAALEYLVYVHLPIEKTIERTKVRFRRMMDVLKSGGKPSLRVDVHDGRGEMTADIGVS